MPPVTEVVTFTGGETLNLPGAPHIIHLPEVLARLIDFIDIELSGRPGRCTHRIDGKRQHSHMVDTWAVMTPLRWIADGYESGVLADDPNMIVSNSGGWHFHVYLDHAMVAHCGCSDDDCIARSRLWTRPRASRTRKAAIGPTS